MGWWWLSEFLDGGVEEVTIGVVGLGYLGCFAFFGFWGSRHGLVLWWVFVCET